MKSTLYKYGITKIEKKQIAVRNTWINVCTTRNFAWFENTSGTIRSRKYFRPVFENIKFINDFWSNINLKRIKKFAEYLENNK